MVPRAFRPLDEVLFYLKGEIMNILEQGELIKKELNEEIKNIDNLNDLANLKVKCSKLKKIYGVRKRKFWLHNQAIER